MSRTTDQWREILNGATEGPWEADPHLPGWIEGKNYADVLTPGDVDCGAFCIGGASTIDGDNLKADTALIAAAPEAVAEVIRLREELESLREACIESAETAEANAPTVYSPEALEAVSSTERDTANIIDRILNPEEKA